MPREDTEAIIQAGIRAPSGDNSQPWIFEVRGSVLRIINVPERDQSLYNFGQCASYIAHGCAIENMVLRAMVRGYFTNVELFPDKANSSIIADLTFKKADLGHHNVLADQIDNRHTNRKPYEPSAIGESELQSLIRSVQSTPEVGVSFVTGNAKNQITEAASTNEQVVLENKDLHDFLYEHITWNQKEDEKNPGFFIDTLEIFGPPRIFFRLFRSWRILKIANKLSVSRLIAAQNARVYASSPTIVVFSVDGILSPQSYVTLGRVIERLWLQASALELSVQPISGLLLLAERIRVGNPSSLSSAHQALIISAKQIISRASKTQSPLFLLRIGHSVPASGHTRRHAPVILYR